MNFLFPLIHLLVCIDLNFALFGGPDWITTTRLAALMSMALLLWQLIQRRSRRNEFTAANPWSFNGWIAPIAVLSGLLVVHALQFLLVRTTDFSMNSVLRFSMLAVIFLSVYKWSASSSCNERIMVIMGSFCSVFLGLFIAGFVVWVAGVDALISLEYFRKTFTVHAVESLEFVDTTVSLNRKMLGFLCLQVYPISLLLGPQSDRSVAYRVATIILLLCNLFLVLYLAIFSGSRQFFLAIFFCWVPGVLIWGRSSSRRVILLLLSILLGGLLTMEALVPFLHDYVEARIYGTTSSDATRIDLARMSLEMISNNLFLGYGPTFFVELSGGDQTHNGFLQLLVDWGVLGAVPVLLMIYWLLVRSAYLLRRASRFHPIGVAGFAIVTPVVSLLSPLFIAFFLDHHYWCLMAMMAGLAVKNSYVPGLVILSRSSPQR